MKIKNEIMIPHVTSYNIDREVPILKYITIMIIKHVGISTQVLIIPKFFLNHPCEEFIEKC